jgi:hypothetical protein
MPHRCVLHHALCSIRGSLSGALECHIYAGNASEPAVKLVPVQITVKHVKAFATAKELVERLARSIFA